MTPMHFFSFYHLLPYATLWYNKRRQLEGQAFLEFVVDLVEIEINRYASSRNNENLTFNYNSTWRLAKVLYQGSVHYRASRSQKVN